jgi:hypothetical protein
MPEAVPIPHHWELASRAWGRKAQGSIESTPDAPVSSYLVSRDDELAGSGDELLCDEHEKKHCGGDRVESSSKAVVRRWLSAGSKGKSPDHVWP